MALIERLGEYLPPVHQDDRLNPYALELDSPEVLGATMHLVTTEKPFIDQTTNPDIAAEGRVFSVYFIGSDHTDSIISKSLEGAIYRKWEYSAEQTRDDTLQYEGNSSFFVVVDMTDPYVPKPAASLRIADCLKGSSATIEYFNEKNNDGYSLPSELMVSEKDLKDQLWDIVGVMAAPEYRDGTVSVWAYHALYKKSLELGVGRWISSIVDKEIGNLHALGIPFREIKDVPKALLYLKRANEQLAFGFYTADVSEIHDEVSNQISELEAIEDESGGFRKIANIARLALNGTTAQVPAVVNIA